MGARMFRKGLAVVVILLFIGMGVVPSTAVQELREKPFPINFDGNTLYVGGTGPNNYTTIQSAIDNASDGDTVFVYNGTYYEHLIINKSLKLKGEDKCSTIISGLNQNTIFIISDFVSVCGFTIQGNYNFHGIYIKDSELCIVDNNIIYLNRYGIVIASSSFIQILNNLILNNTYGGIYFFTSNNSIIDDNFISDNGGHGIDMFYSPYNTIRDNCIHWNKDCGIRCCGCEDLTVYNNMIGENCGNGIDYFDTNSINISDNNIWNNQGHGIAINSHSSNGNISGNRIADNDRSGIYAFNVHSSNISWNNISGNKNSGVYSFVGSGSTLTMNKIERNNEYGIYLKSIWENNVSYNTISDNGDIGCYLNLSMDNKIICNTFIDNHRDAFFNIRSDNIWDGNYWNRPRILPKPILGKIYFLWYLIKIPMINIDWHPAREPYDIGV